MNDKQKIIESGRGSIFSVFSQKEISEVTVGNNRKVAICGRIKNPGIIDVPQNASLKDIIDLCGGILDNRRFKAAHLGMPFGDLLVEEEIDKEIDFDVFGNSSRMVIILSDEDCIIQYAIYYIDYLISKVEDKDDSHKDAISILKKILFILDSISKGKSNMRDIYILRNLSSDEKSLLGQNHNIIQEIIDNFYEEIEEHIEEGKCYTMQCSHLIKITITDKCIGCGACKRVCPVDCIDGEIRKKHHIDYTRCVHCGRCIQVCPVNAITSGDNTLKFLRDLSTPNKIVITQMAPSIRVTIGEAFGFEFGENVENKIAAALRKIGVDYVFDTNWGADIVIMEEAAELQERLEKYFSGNKDVKLPILTSCCPSWVRFIEMYYPEMVDVPSTAKSPMQMFAAVAKDIWAKEKGYSRNEITSVAIMPCVAKKYEASRPEFSSGLNYDVDYVITTTELIDIFKDSGIDLKNIEDEEIDKMLGEYTGAGVIFGRTGGVIEAALRNAYVNMTGKKLEHVEFSQLRGYDSFRTAEVEINNHKLKIGVVYGLDEARKLLDKIRNGEEFYHAIEIMACPDGCVGGGGQPKLRKDKDKIIQARGDGLNNIDKNKDLRISLENPEVQMIYDKYLDHPLSHKAHELLHTEYFPRIKKSRKVHSDRK